MENSLNSTTYNWVSRHGGSHVGQKHAWGKSVLNFYFSWTVNYNKYAVLTTLSSTLLRTKKKTAKNSEIWVRFFTIGCVFCRVGDWGDLQIDSHVSFHDSFKIQFAGIVPVFLEVNGRISAGLPIKYLKNGTRDYMNVSAWLTGLKNPMKSLTDRRGKVQITKTTKATNKFLLGFTSDFRFCPGSKIFYVIGAFFNLVCWAEIFPRNQPLSWKKQCGGNIRI